jgi:hypothetical protein
MAGRHRLAYQGRPRNGRGRRAVRVVSATALAVGLGITVAVLGANKGVSSAGLNAAGLAGSGPSASPSTSPKPTPAPSASPSPSPSPAASQPAVMPQIPVADVAEFDPVGPAGNPINLNQTPAQAATSMNCTLTVPPNPLSAPGLATPWQLGDGCSEANPNLTAFVEATILTPGGQISVYDPLVVTAGTKPAVQPVPPNIPVGSQVIIDTGFNGGNLVLEGAGAVQGGCIDAFGNSIIAQTAACNAQAFYQDANFEIAVGMLTVPALGVGQDGEPCPTTRDFSLIDQDQSDNVLTSYLVNSRGQTAQDSPANQAAMPRATTLTNGSDDGLLGHFVDLALGCRPFIVPNSTNPHGADDSQALNELSAAQNQQGTIALLPVNDPQLLLGGQFSVGKTDTYRMLTDQPLLSSTMNTTQNAATYCLNMVNIAPSRLELDAPFEARFPTPVPTLGNNLATFMAARLSASFMNLNCQAYGLKNPVRLKLNHAGVATAATYSTAQQSVNFPGSSGISFTGY